MAILPFSGASASLDRHDRQMLGPHAELELARRREPPRSRARAAPPPGSNDLRHARLDAIELHLQRNSCPASR